MRSMSIIRKVVFVLFSFIISSIVLSGCGYKPTTYYAKKELSGKVFVKLFIDLKDPKNAVLVKDAMNKLIIQKLGARLVYKESLADTIMNVKINSVNMTVLQYDTDGYNKLYRAVVKILVDYRKKDAKEVKTINVSGETDFSVDDDDDDTITDSARFDAISEASDDALNEVLSKIALFSLIK